MMTITRGSMLLVLFVTLSALPAFADSDDCGLVGLAHCRQARELKKIQGRGNLAICVDGILAADCISGTGKKFDVPTSLGNAVTDISQSISQSVKEARAKFGSRPVCVTENLIKLSQKVYSKDIDARKELSMSNYGIDPTYSTIYVYAKNGLRVPTGDDSVVFDLTLDARGCFPVTRVEPLEETCAMDGCGKVVRVWFSTQDAKKNMFDVVVKMIQRE